MDTVDHVLLAVAEQLDQVNVLAVRRLKPEPDPAEWLGGAVGEQALGRPADPSRRRSKRALRRGLDQIGEPRVENIDVEARAMAGAQPDARAHARPSRKVMLAGLMPQPIEAAPSALPVEPAWHLAPILRLDLRCSRE
jgi:hypothetical protein